MVGRAGLRRQYIGNMPKLSEFHLPWLFGMHGQFLRDWHMKTAMIRLHAELGAVESFDDGLAGLSRVVFAL
jgi:hypothetical protein